MLITSKVAVCRVAHGQALVCTSALAADERLFSLSGRRVSVPSRYTIQVQEEEHILPEASTLWAFANHHCEPSCRIDFDTWEIVTRRAMQAGEEITFNYLTTEWELAEPFICVCGAKSCVNKISGFRHLDSRARQALAALLSPFLRSSLNGIPLAEPITTP
jgi:SET domain